MYEVHASSSLTVEQRRLAVALFEEGWGYSSVSTRLVASRHAVRKLYHRWRARGQGALVAKSSKRVFTFEFKRNVVARFLAGETKTDLAQEFELSSPELVSRWASTYRREGEMGLRPKRRGRVLSEPVEGESELERLRRDNERLRAEVAYLGKVQALGVQRPR